MITRRQFFKYSAASGLFLASSRIIPYAPRIFSPREAHAAITLDSISSRDAATGTADPETFAHTVGVTANILIVLVAHRLTTEVSGVTYAGAALTLAREDGPAGAACTAIYYKTSPATGANNISVDFAGAPSTVSIRGVSLIGADTTNPINASNGTENATGGDLSQTITTTVNGCWILDVFANRTGAGGGTVTPGTQTGRTNYATPWDYEPGGNEMAAGGTKFENPNAGTYTCDWTQTGTAGTALSIVAIAPSGAAAPARRYPAIIF